MENTLQYVMDIDRSGFNLLRLRCLRLDEAHQIQHEAHAEETEQIFNDLGSS